MTFSQFPLDHEIIRLTDKILMMSKDTTLLVFGSCELFQTGRSADSCIPKELLLSFNYVPKLISCGGWHSAILFNNGKCGFLGCNEDKQIPFLDSNVIRTISLISESNIKSVATGALHTIILSTNGEANFYGSNDKKQLSDRMENINSVFAKFDNSAVVTNDGLIYVFGNGKEKYSISLPNGEKPEEIEFTNSETAILTENGILHVYKDQEITLTFEKVVSIACSRYKILFLASNGIIYEIHQNKCVAIKGIDGLPIKLYAGGAHYGCITYEGEFWAWGCGTSGQIGQGSYLNSPNPIHITKGTKKKVISASLGEKHSMLMLSLPNSFIPNIHPLMREEDMIKSLLSESIMQFGFTPPEFDVKF